MISLKASIQDAAVELLLWTKTGWHILSPESALILEAGFQMTYLVRWQQKELKIVDADYLLADQIRQGDLAAFEELVEKYKQPLINFASRFLGDPTEAHDVAQNVFVKVFKLASRFQYQSKFSTWLYAIARNLCRNEYRRRVRQRTESFDWSDQGSLKTRQSSSKDLRQTTMAEAVFGRELEQKIEESMALLSEKQRSAILLRQERDLSYEEIAMSLGTSVSATKALIHHARQKLKRRLQPYLRTGAWAPRGRKNSASGARRRMQTDNFPKMSAAVPIPIFVPSTGAMTNEQ
jgi:RNA polymerase sigma-70 factor (ECF subfamily)